MSLSLRSDHGVRPSELWLGLLGGAVAWFAHLLLAYAIAEFGCAGSEETAVLGITLVTWMLMAATLLTGAAAAGATLLACRSMRLLREQEREPGRAGLFVARAGAITSGLFVFIILVQSVPIFYYLQGC